MLGKPYGRWTEISLNKKIVHGSYLTDIPIDFLKAFYEAVIKRNDVIVRVDAESNGEYLYVVTPYAVYLIKEADEPELFFNDEENNISKLASELCNDIENNLEDWIKWEPTLDEENLTDTELEEYRQHLINRKDSISQLILEIKNCIEYPKK